MMSSAVLSLRHYQEEAIRKTQAAWYRTRRPAVVLPTGAGKTVIFSHLARRWVQDHTGLGRGPRKVVILVHRDELVTQTVNKLHAVAPVLAVGVVKGTRNELDADVIVASVQTLRKPARLFPLLGKVGLVIVDECHHATAVSYRTIMEDLGCFAALDGPGAVAVGFTATMSRADKAALGDVWDEVVHSLGILDLVMDPGRYLVEPRGRMVTVDGMSLEEVKRSRGDYQAGSLSDLLISSGAIAAVADACVEHDKDRPTVLFAPTVESAELFTAALNERGIRAATVWGAMGEERRRDTLRRFDAGELDALCNCMVLTEGWDSPRCSKVVVARPTLSAALYIQMVGRGLRPYPGKEDALVLDVVGASQMHALATLADLDSRVPEMLPGESLTEAVERAVREGALELTGDVSHREVDLFHRSASVWLKTYAGCLFIPAGNHTVFLWPEYEGDTYKVAIRPNKGKGGRYAHEGLPLAVAMSWAEQEAQELENGSGMSVSGRSASWRKKRQDPTDGQLSWASSFGLDTTGKTRVEVSDMISIHVASSMIDRAYTNVMKKRSTP